MKNRIHDFLVFIGRFQAFHFGHAKVIETALQRCNKKVIVLVGSSNRARDWFNPFVYEERMKVITDWYDDEMLDKYGDRLIVLPLNDHLYATDDWLIEVQSLVTGAVRSEIPGWTDYPPKVGLIGHAKDHTSFYLGLFPQWGDNINVGAFTDKRLFNSTDVRDAFFKLPDDDTEVLDWGEVLEGIPDATIRFLTEFHKSEHYQHMLEYHDYIRQYRIDHAFANPNLSYSPGHTAADACVTQSGHILLVERKYHPGKGLLAMPGGFVKSHQSSVDAMLDELWQETKLKIPRKAVQGSITDFDIFDDPHRSARGRIFSHTYRVELEPRAELPKVKGGSDAKEAMWIPLSELRPDQFFEDHYFIIKAMTSGKTRSHHRY
jgi:bifunctional NMN adenylyltransferase/nudix hydrolase